MIKIGGELLVPSCPKVIKSLKHIPAIRNENDDVIFDEEEKANVMNEFFASINIHGE
jgi:hypothetical protein